MKKSKVVDKKSDEKEGFFQKYKEDKKFNAKVQLVGYGVLIVLVILFLNISNMNSLGYNNVSDTNNFSNEEDNNNIEKVSLLEKINSNYEYDINVDVTKVDGSTYNYRYYGKSYDNNIILNKTFDNTNNVYYGKDGYYYIKNEANEYGIIDNSVVFDLVDSNYIELDEVLEFIGKASLDHVLDSSNGDKESVYNVLVRDIVISNKTDNVVTINVSEKDEKLNIVIDYTNLISVLDTSISSCKISYIYSNIGKVDEFKIVE